jgi:hypothetical protein
MSRWFRFYDDTINDPKALKLSDKTFRIWVGMLCLASKNDGVLPSFEDMTILLRIKPEKLQPEIEKLIKAELLDHDDGGIKPHNWNTRQYKTDVTDPTNATRQKRYRNARVTVKPVTDPTNATRQKRYRDRHRVTEDTVTVKRPDTDTDTDTENRIQKEDNAPDGAPPKYAFESGCIRLTLKNLTQWKSAFVNLDLEAELLGLTEWAGTQGNNWFCAVSGALAKRNREIGLRQKQQLRPNRSLYERPLTDFIT